jgi:hypothetical protein
MKQEYWFAAVFGLIIFAIVLDAIVNPLTTSLPSPYHYFTPEIFSVYPLTTVSIILKAAAIFIIPILLLSFAGWSKTIKGIIVFVVSGVLQLYSLQDLVSGAHAVPVEWALSFTLSGMLLIIPAAVYIIMGVVQKATGEESQDYIVKEEEKE